MLWIWSFQDDPSAFLAGVLICKLTALLCAPSFLNPLKVNVLVIGVVASVRAECGACRSPLRQRPDQLDEGCVVAGTVRPQKARTRAYTVSGPCFFRLARRFTLLLRAGTYPSAR